MEKTGTTGTALQGDNSPELDSRKRKRSMWSRPQKGLRRGSCDVISNKSDLNFPGNVTRKSSTCSALLDSEFFGETYIALSLASDKRSNMLELLCTHIWQS